MRQRLIVPLVGIGFFWAGCGGHGATGTTGSDAGAAHDGSSQHGGSGGSGSGSAGHGGAGAGTTGTGTAGSAGTGTAGAAGTGTAGGAGTGTAGAGGGLAAMYSISGTVNGLVGSGLVLRDNGGDDLAVPSNGAFTFATKLAGGTAFTVTVAAQPTTPSQTCAVSAPTSVATHDITDVVVTCATNSFHVGGTVSGLHGSGLTLKNNNADAIVIDADGTFTFATQVASGSAFTVTIGAQPTAPTQSCVVMGGSGTVGAGDVSTVAVACSTDAFLVGGMVTGLAGSGLVLHNGTDDLAVTASGSFSFPTPVPSGSTFAVTVKSSPTSPSQTCVVTGGSGVVASGPVNTVAVACSTDTHTVAGTVSGLAGSGLVLQNSQGDNLVVSANGTFTFATRVASGATYAVTVLTQPSSPTQTCTVTGGSGTIISANVTGVSVTCATRSYAVGGTVVGLNGTGLVLQDNGADDLPISANGAFTFATAVASGATFNITVSTQPGSPAQSCTVSGGQGTVGAAAVMSVVVNCATNRFAIGGDVTGLAGSGLQLALNGGTALAVGANGTFAFPTTVASGGSFNVVTVAQPASPWQTCTVVGGSGTVAAANITSVHVNCATDRHTVGGNVSGLVGAGLVLRDNGGDDLTVAASGAFTFATSVASGGGYLVTVATQPSSPTQTCTVTAGSGAVGNADLTNVAVECVTNTYAVGGTITGLIGSVALMNGSDTLTLSSNGGFVFPGPVASGGSYAVSVATQPQSPSQTCTVTNGTGSIVSSDISTVVVTCAVNTFSVGGTVTGLLGSGLVLQDNGGDDLPVSADGSFTFATNVASGATYALTVKTQPGSPTQTCAISGGSGTVGGGPVSSIAVNCATNTYVIGGTASGLAGAGLVLTNAGGNDLAISGNGSFAFSVPVSSGGAYAVAIKTQPTSPWQTCSVAGGSGTIGSSDVNSVTVTCVTNTYTVAVTTMGVAGTGLVLQDNGADNLTIAASGTSAFATRVASGGSYAVTVLTQPTSPTQTCVASSPSGVVAGADVTVNVTCTTNTYGVSVTTGGLAGTGLVLQDNGGDDLAVAANGASSFSTSVASGAAYAVTVKTQPSSPAQTCVVGNGTGTIGAADVTSVTVICTTNTYAIGGTVSGLAGAGLVLRDNGGDDLAISANGSFAFTTKVASGGSYAVSIATQPSSPSQTCTVSGGSGTVGAANVNQVVINCATNTFTVGGTVSGLAGTGLVLRDNGGDDLTISGNGSFAFTTAIASGGAYAVTVSTQPSSPSQTCTVTNGSGTVGSSNVTNVAVTCTTNSYNVSVTVSGLAGTGFVMQDNGGDNLSVASNGTKTFATKVASGAIYSVSVLTNPSGPLQTCVVASPTGTVAAADVTLTATCITNTYTVGGSVGGLTGTGLVLQNNAGDDLAVTASGSFTFATPIANAATYAVTVKTHPTNQSCIVSNGSGTMGTAAVTNVVVTCGAASVKVLLDCSAGASVINTFTGTGCFGPVAAGGASYILMQGTPRATLWSGTNCTGCSYVVTTDKNFCGTNFSSGGCGTLNDQVHSVSIP